MASEIQRIPVYFIGVHHKLNRPLFYVVRGETYVPPRDKDGNIVVGGVVHVYANHVEALLNKSKVYMRNKGYFQSFTTDPGIAAAVASKYRSGESTSVPEQMSIDQALSLVTTAEVKERVVADMSDAELMATLAARGINIDPIPATDVVSNVAPAPKPAPAPAATAKSNKAKSEDK